MKIVKIMYADKYENMIEYSLWILNRTVFFLIIGFTCTKWESISIEKCVLYM